MNYSELYRKANEAGREAAEACIPTPMYVGQPSTPFGNDVDFSKPHYFVSDGVCGFAWVDIFLPKTHKFCQFLLTSDLASKRDGKGVYIWISDYNQSMARKEAHAYAMAKFLRENGITAYSGSRID